MKYSGGSVHCLVHGASTEVGGTDSPLPEYFTIGCAYCMAIENRLLRTKLEQVTKQRNALVEAIDVAKILKVNP